MNAFFVQVVAPALIMLRALLACVRNGSGRRTEWTGGVIQFNAGPIQETTITSGSDLEARIVRGGSGQTDVDLGSISTSSLGLASVPGQLQEEKTTAMESAAWALYCDQYALTWLENREPAH
jgi:hypothetical protein